MYENDNAEAIHNLSGCVMVGQVLKVSIPWDVW